MIESEAAVEVNRQEGMGIVFAFGETWGESLRKEFQKKLKHSHFQNVWKIHCVYTYYLSSTSWGKFLYSAFPWITRQPGYFSIIAVCDRKWGRSSLRSSLLPAWWFLLPPELPYKNNEQLLLSWTYLLSFLFGFISQTRSPWDLAISQNHHAGS